VLNQSTTDSGPVGRARVVAHRVGRSVQGPVDSTLTDRTGAFRLEVEADSASLYLVSARHDGIEYFSPPLRGTPDSTSDPVVLVVSDTSSTVPVRAPHRHIVIAPPNAERTREIVDLVTLETAGARFTRVASDSLSANWAGPLPRGVLDARVGESDFSPDAVQIARDSVFLFAPIAPGEKQLMLQYWIPADQTELTIPSSSEETNLYIEGGKATATGPGLTAVAPEEIMGSQFSHWIGTVPLDSVVVVRLAAAGGQSSAPVVALVAVMVVILLAAASRFLRRPVESGAAATSAGLVETLARLDAEYSGRQAQVEPEEWARYRRDRARLKQEIAAALAEERRPR